MTRKNNILKFLIMFFVGYFCYMGIEVMFRGYTYILMGITGGIAFVLIDRINNICSFDMDILLQCSIGSMIITVFELIIGRGLQILHLPAMWDYSNLPLNYKGVICLPFSLLWILLSFGVILLADAINYYLFHEDPAPYYKLFGKKLFNFPKRNCYVSK